MDVYYLHLLENPKSLIAKIFGLFTLKIENQDEYHFIIQCSITSIPR